MKILVIRLSALGDILLTTGPIKQVKLLKPDVEFHLLTSNAGAEIYRNSIEFDKVHVLPKGLNFLSLIKFYFNLESYDKIIDLQAKPKTSLLKFLKSSSFFQIKKQSRQRRAFVKNRSYKKELNQHVVEKYFEVLGRVLDLTATDLESLRPYLPTTPLISDKDFDFSQSIAIHPYASQANKVWPYINELITKIHGLGLKTIIIGQSEEQSEYPKETLNLTNKTSIQEMASILAKCQALVSTDSGPMHLSVAVSTPTLALFGPTTKEFGFYPTFNHTAVAEVKNLDCRPCHIHGGNQCPLGHHKCMKDISVEMVLKKLEDLISV